MKQLFANYQLRQIILILILAAFAIKEFIVFVDWTKKRTRQAIQEKDKPIETIEQQKDEIKQLKQQVKEINSQISLLVKSDIDTLRHSLTKDHHYFCYKLKCIDDYSLDCMEKQYENYKAEGGNTFVDQLMQEVRALPRRLEQKNR